MELSLIDKTERYRFEKIERNPDYFHERKEFSTVDEIRTLFLHYGSLGINVESNGKKNMYALKAGEGFIFGPNLRYNLSCDSRIFAVQSSSQIAEGKIIEILDKGDEKEESELGPFKLVRNPKRVNKPWGHELWISWFRDYHVLKQIGMKAGNMSSLQLHGRKLETNYLVKGEADVIDGYPMDLSLSEDEMKNKIGDVDLSEYTNRKKAGMHWTSRPGIVHRVISVADYIAYETSTPELDDVIRLSDVSGRQSGRIDSEHKLS